MPRPRRRLPIVLLGGGALAAAAVLGALMLRRPPAPVSSEDRPPSSGAAPISRMAALPPPIFLIARADTPGPPTAFRSVDAGSRLPRDAGTVSSVDGDEVEINLGSLDGLAKGSTLRLVGRTGPRATVTVETLFRERCRGRVESGSARPGDRAEVSRSDHVNALLQHADARAATGDITPARRLAELAVTRAQASETTADVTRRALTALGMLEYRAGAVDEAARHLRTAVGELDRAPAAPAEERVQALNALAAILIDTRAYAEAETILEAARPHAAGQSAVRIANNLAALEAMRGDRTAAEALYRSALETAGDSPELEGDRRAIRRNLEALQAAR
jgi:tetratricopeptide (TPR) repeat protein